MSARLFQVVREADITGVSGTGVVADGVEFPDGTAVVRWRELEPGNPNYERGVRATTVVFPNVRAVEALHGHNGATRLTEDGDWTHAKCVPPPVLLGHGGVCETCWMTVCDCVKEEV